ncbi:MAG: ATP-binding cassette domain-containing protein [Myxococcales bacterium]|nr:ATP-binding cassette domain-containing protein [Myxococcales bacterium]
MTQSALRIEKLRVALPTGRVLLDDIDLTLKPGEVAVLLGGSGAGKSTLSRVLFEREQLEREGFEVRATQIDYDKDSLGLVPQHGALFDHLSVGGNIELAMRYRKHPTDTEHSVASWLEQVGLSPSLANAQVGKLSGGQIQRVAVARALASERRLLLLDEPSVGLDPHRVRTLARLLRKQVAEMGLSAIVVTHDPAFAAGVADKLYLLDPHTRKLEHLFAEEWPGPVEAPDIDAETRGRWLLRLEETVDKAIEQAPAPSDDASSSGRSSLIRGLARSMQQQFAPFGAAGHAVIAAPAQVFGHTRDFLSIIARIVVQAALRPALFYGIVSVLIGFTLLFVISKVGGAGVRTSALLQQIGGSYAVALAPPLSALLFVAASGSATNAWFGSMELTRQTAALEALGIRKTHYLWAPAWLGLAICYFLVASLVGLGMLFGGWLLCQQQGVHGSWDLLIGDIVDPRPERSIYVARASFLLWFYAWGIASNVLAMGSAHKRSSDDVTRAMTGSVVSATLWVVALELSSVLWIFGA